MVGNQTNNKATKNLIKVLICIFLVLAFGIMVYAQKCPKYPVENYPIEKIDSREKVIEKGWREIKTKNITFYAPDNLKENAGRGYEGNGNSYQSEDLYISIDRDAAAFYPRYEKTYASYSEKVFCIDGKFAWFWTYNNGVNYFAGVFFFFEEDKYKRLVIGFSSKQSGTFQTAEKIVKSIEFIKSN